MSTLPALTGEQLIALLEKDGWIQDGKRTHGISMKKNDNGRFLVTIIPINKRRPIPEGTLGAILSMKQTRIGKKGLEQLMKKFGK